MALPSVGELGWAGHKRVIWYVFSDTRGLIVRGPTVDNDLYEHEQWPVGKIAAINRHGLTKVEVDLTDDELALIAREVLLNA